MLPSHTLLTCVSDEEEGGAAARVANKNADYNY